MFWMHARVLTMVVLTGWQVVGVTGVVGVTCVVGVTGVVGGNRGTFVENRA